MVRGNAALSLVRFGDATGHSQIVALLQPARINAPATGRVVDAAAIDQFGFARRAKTVAGGRLALIAGMCDP